MLRLNSHLKAGVNKSGIRLSTEACPRTEQATLIVGRVWWVLFSDALAEISLRGESPIIYVATNPLKEHIKIR